VLQAAAAYIEEHQLQKVVEDAINATIKAKPTEPFSFMVRPLPAWLAAGRQAAAGKAAVGGSGGGCGRQQPAAHAACNRVSAAAAAVEWSAQQEPAELPAGASTHPRPPDIAPPLALCCPALLFFAAFLTARLLQAEQLKAKAPAAILSVKARQVFDSRGNPTVEAEVRQAGSEAGWQRSRQAGREAGWQ
jgi:hypothetical protein